MKNYFLVVIFAVAGYFAFLKMKNKPSETQNQQAPPAPPPIIEVKPVEVKPVISEEEQTKIIRTANDTDPQVRWEAMLLLEKIKAPAAFPVLFDKLIKDTEPDVRIKIIRLLGDRPGPEVTRHLAMATKDMVPEVRLEALQALEKTGDPSAGSAIMECLRDTEDSVRLQALKTLNSLQDRRQAEALAEQKRQEELRRKAAEEAQKQQKK